jgi:hypothetical protein
MAGSTASLADRLDRFVVRIEPPRGTLRHVAWRMFLVVAIISLVAMLYYPAALATAGRSVDLTTALDLAIPFVPWTWWLYYPHYILGMVVTTVTAPDPRPMHRIFLAILLSQIACCTIYFLVPSAFPRPLSVGDADPFTGAIVTWFWTMDPPNNTFPSTHVATACLVAMGAWRWRHPFRWYSVLVAVGVFVTVHTAKQHYWVDAVGGLVVAAVAFQAALRIWPLPSGARSAPRPEPRATRPAASLP